MKIKFRGKVRNVWCLLFGHKYRCFMACQSLCRRCGNVWEYNWEKCGICGGNLYFEEDNKKQGWLKCEKKCVKWKMSKKKYKENRMEDFISEGFLDFPKISTFLLLVYFVLVATPLLNFNVIAFYLYSFFILRILVKGIIRYKKYKRLEQK